VVVKIALDRQYLGRTAAVVRTLEDKIGIECDPVFVETYLQTIPGYKESVGTIIAVEDVFHDLEPQVQEILAHQSSLDGKTHVDESSIRSAIKEVVEKGSISKKAKVAAAQSGLFGSDTSVKPRRVSTTLRQVLT
jgi:hypothetical protein